MIIVVYYYFHVWGGVFILRVLFDKLIQTQKIVGMIW